MLSRALARLAVVVACSEKVKWGSRVTPRILGFRHSGKGWLPNETPGSSLDWCVSEVKRVACDLVTETVSPLSAAHSATSPMWVEREAPASNGRCEDAAAVKSSAYDEIRGADEG